MTSREGGVVRGMIGYAGRTLEFMAYQGTGAGGGATSIGTEGDFAYLRLGNVPLGQLLPPLPPVPGIDPLRHVSAPALLVVSDSNNRRIGPQNLPAPLRAWVDPLFPTASYTVSLGMGLNLLTQIDLTAAPGMSEAYNAFGLGSPKQPVGAILPQGYARAVLTGAAPTPGMGVTLWGPVASPSLPGLSLSWLDLSHWGFALTVNQGGVATMGVSGDITLHFARKNWPFHGGIGTFVLPDAGPVVKLVGAYKTDVSPGCT